MYGWIVCSGVAGLPMICKLEAIPEEEYQQSIRHIFALWSIARFVTIHTAVFDHNKFIVIDQVTVKYRQECRT